MIVTCIFVRENSGNAELVGDGARVLSARAAEARQRVRARVVPARRRQRSAGGVREHPCYNI